MNFCKDCHFYLKRWWFGEAYCLHKEAIYVECKVEGKTSFRLCREMRWDHSPCRNEGELFEPKKGKK